MIGLVCDVDAVRALAVGAAVHARDLLETVLAEGIGLVVPAAAYATAWAGSTPPGRMLLDNFVRLSVVTIDPLDAATAGAGRRCSAPPLRAVVGSYER